MVASHLRTVFRVLGFRFWGLGFWGLGFRVRGVGFRVSGLGVYWSGANSREEGLQRARGLRQRHTLLGSNFEGLANSVLGGSGDLVSGL